MLARSLQAFAIATVVAACGGGDTGTEPEVVVADATLAGMPPHLLGATSNAVFWTAGSTIGGASLSTLPASGTELATSLGAIAAAGDSVVFAGDGILLRVDLAATPGRIAVGTPEALAADASDPPQLAWTTAADVHWGTADVIKTATLTKIDSCDHAWVTPTQIFAACDGSTGRRLFSVETLSAQVSPLTSSSVWATMFPNGPMAGSTYVGRIVGANDFAVMWLVEEQPSKRAVLIRQPVSGDATVLLEHVTNATGFFVGDSALYWQEGSELLTAPLDGGAADIVATLPGDAGAFADGYIYYTDGSGIARLRVD